MIVSFSKYGRRFTQKLIGTFCACWASSVYGQPAPQNISPGFKIFTNFCVATLGSSTKAEQQFGDGNELSRRLPLDFVTRMHGGVVGGKAWTLRSPKGERFLLDYHPKGICSVKFADLEPASALSEFDVYINMISPNLKSTSINRSIKNKKTHNSVEYKILTENREYLFVISGAKDKRAETKAILSVMSTPR